MSSNAPHAIAHFAIIGWLLALTFAVAACGSDDDTTDRPPKAEISVEAQSDNWRVVSINGIACVERSWVGQYNTTEYAISCVGRGS